MGAAFAPGPAGSLAASAGQVVVLTSPVAPPAPEPEPPQATFAPTGPVVPFDPAPAPPPAPAPVPPAPAPELEPDPEPPADEPAPEPDPEKPSIGHVYVVVLPGVPGAEAALTPKAPPSWLRDELMPQGALLTGYEPVGTSSLSNRLALVSGQEPTPDTEADCPDYDACVLPAETKTLADQLGTWGFDWRAYVEGMEEPCRRPDPLDPFVYFHSVVDLADCSQHVLPLDRFDPEAVFSLVAPLTADQPERFIQPILDSKQFKEDGLLAVVFDRAPDALVLSPFVEARTKSDKRYTPYSLLKTVEDRIGLGEHLGHADDPGVKTLGKDVFDRDLDPLQQPEAP
jgi:hypothetical protein